jgi:hemoglobin
MTTLKDISRLDDIKLLVDTFYSKVQQDDLIGPIFNEKIQDRWPMHLERMYGFWETVLLEVRSYSGSPFPPHATLPIHKEHFDRWMELFTKTVDTLFAGPIADEAKWRAEKMAEMFNYKIDYFRKANQKPLT